VKQLLVTFGKIREPYVRDGLKEYLKRIRRYGPIDLVSLKEEKIDGNQTDFWIREREGKRLLRQVPRNGVWVGLERTGRGMDSLEFFSFLQRRRDQGAKTIYYLIGGPLGLSPEVLRQADVLLSLSPLTYTHELAALILAEQIYRFFTYIAGKKYHK
jgi:23S rRNA (pseudouridine1915-N3)-methyltransferase